MANPSLDDGYLKIPNELADRLAEARFTGSEWRIIWVILRQTLGWVDPEDSTKSKEWDQIALSQFEEKTDMTHANVFKTLKGLVDSRVISKEIENRRYKFNQNYDEWVSHRRPEKSVSSRIPKSVSPGILLPVSPRIPTISIIKSNSYFPHEAERGAGSLGKPTGDLPFSQDAAYAELMRRASPVHRLAGRLMFAQGYSYKNQKQFSLAFTRALRPAKELSGNYTDDEIRRAIELTEAQARQLGSYFTPQTVVKNIQRVVTADVANGDLDEDPGYDPNSPGAVASRRAAEKLMAEMAERGRQKEAQRVLEEQAKQKKP